MVCVLARAMVLLLVLCGAGEGVGRVTAGPDAVALQRELDGRRWVWDGESATVLNSVQRFPEKYGVSLTSRPGKFLRSDYLIRVFDGERSIYQWTGHYASVFQAVNDTLYYADFSPIATGCTVVAVDLKTGKVLWESGLEGLGPIDHSKYRNEVTLYVDDGHIVVTGRESSGSYKEYVDTATGKTLAHRVYTKAERDAALQ